MIFDIILIFIIPTLLFIFFFIKTRRKSIFNGLKMLLLFAILSFVYYYLLEYLYYSGIYELHWVQFAQLLDVSILFGVVLIILIIINAIKR